MMRFKPDHRIPCECISGLRSKQITSYILPVIVVIILLITPEFVSGSSKGDHSIFRDKTLLSVSSWFGNYPIPRGGGIGLGGRRKDKKSLYIRALDDEIIWLEQQLRRVEQEKRTLKSKMAKRQQIREDVSEPRDTNIQVKPQKTKNVLAKKDEDLLRLANLEQLEKQKSSLEIAKAQLESIKLEYNQKLKELHSDLFVSTSEQNALEKRFLSHVKELEDSIQKVRDAAATLKIQNDPDLSRKIDEACQAAIKEFWVEGNQKLEEHENRLRAIYERELLEERRLATLAVEKQRQKMRALARATAIREKEIAAKMKKQSRHFSQAQSKVSGINPNEKKKKCPVDEIRDEKLQQERLKAIREEAERKAKEEEERMWLELESELEMERERLQRVKQREEEERRRCEQEELERRRLLQQHAIDMEERIRQEQKEVGTNNNGNGGNSKSLFKRLFGSRKENVETPVVSQPSFASIENYQRRVIWQPSSLPPREVVRIQGPSASG